ncbi:MAG: hypothetical protein RMJ19_04100 [Gemmatales bacterium]|nr:hypothetical protein [Gemmatales bacterium]MDW8174829.1 hypothetical protein [Gemmatales bacterium]
MKLKRLCLTGAILGLVIALGTVYFLPQGLSLAQPEKPKHDKNAELKKQVQGKWKVVERWIVWPPDGKKIEHQILGEEEHIFQVIGDRVILHQDKWKEPIPKLLGDWLGGFYLAMAVDANRSPIVFDLVEKRSGRLEAPGIIRIDGDWLTYIRSIDPMRRPSSFRVEEAPPASVMIRARRIR